MQLIIKFPLIIFCITSVCRAQDSIKTIELNGYVKSLQTWSFPGRFETLSNTSMIHNRVNMYMNIRQHIRAGVSFRNRLIWGDEVRQIPGYDQLLRNRQEFINLSVNWIHRADWILHTNTERLWVEAEQKRWNLRVGRQRINWGVTTIWNPSDLFNTYNFLDVDYEERPGADALKLHYQIKELSDLEFAFAPGRGQQVSISGLRYTFHKRETDVQIIAGFYGKRATIGTGWAGHFGDMGWKGEIQYFFKKETEKAQLNAVTEFDYVLKNGWYLQSGILYNYRGLNKMKPDNDTLRFEFTPLQLMPGKLNFVVTGSKEINPVFSFSSSFVYSPNSDLLLILPNFQCRLTNNVDADLVWQSFFLRNSSFKALNHRGFIRFRWSF